VKVKGLFGASGRTPVGGGKISWTQAYDRRMRKFNLEVVLAALIALMILITGLLITLEAFHNIHRPHPRLSVQSK